MNWGAVEAEAEVTEWLSALPGNTFGHVRFYIDLLADQGVALKEPHTRQLRGKLRELLHYEPPPCDPRPETVERHSKYRIGRALRQMDKEKTSMSGHLRREVEVGRLHVHPMRSIHRFAVRV